MLPVTACIITFQEEARIGACLESVAFCDEVVVVDSGSTDRTRALAEAAGARVIEREWPGHIEQKNFAIDQARHEWVLCLDADERVTPELRRKIEALFAAGGPPADGYTVNRRNIYLERWIRGGGWYPDRKLRLFRRTRGRWGGVNPHDHVRLDPPGPVEDLRADLEHLSYEGISDHLRTIDYFSTIAAGQKLARRQGAVSLHLLLDPPFKFLKMFVLQAGFRDGWRGFVVAALGAFYVFLRYAKLWELIHVRGLEPGSEAALRYGRRGEAAPGDDAAA